MSFLGDELKEELKVNAAAEHFFGLPIRYLGYFWNALRNGFPSRKMYVIAVVGIEDTSALTEFIQHVLFSLRKNVGSFTRVAVKFNDTRIERNGEKNTNRAIQKFLSEQKDKKADYAVIQLTPDDIQREIYLHINFDMVVASGMAVEETKNTFPTEQEYLTALQLFLKHVGRQRRKMGIKKTLLVNLDYFKIKKNPMIDMFDLFGYAISPKDLAGFPVLTITNFTLRPYASQFVLNGISFETRLLGKSGLSYTVAGLAVVQALHYTIEEVSPALLTFVDAPGHMEYIQHRHQFDVIVDSARTPQEVRAILSVARSLQEEKRTALLMCVIGVSGIEYEEDILQKAGLVADVCNRIFVTIDDAYDKNPDMLLDLFISGFPEDVRNRQSVVMYRRIPDRKQAIEEAIEMARPQDIVLVLGKINDRWMVGAGRQKTPWDERKIIHDAIDKVVARDTRRYEHGSKELFWG